MKLKKLLYWFSLFLLYGGLSGCAQATEERIILPSEEPLSTPSKTPVATLTFTPPASQTAEPTQNVILTLPPETAQTKLFDFLAGNGGCRLPCLWNITPGLSTFQDAREILLPLSALGSSVHLDPAEVGSISLRFRDGDLEIYTDIGFVTNLDDNMVIDIGFITEAHRIIEGGYEDVFDSTFFGNTSSAYMLYSVLSMQGVPETVLISTSGGPLTRGGTGGFEIVLLYPEDGVFVRYTTQMNIIGKNVRGCPQNAHVRMELFPPGDSDNFFVQLDKGTWPYIKEGFKPIEEVTSSSIEDFYETFREPTDECIETLASLWPIPEP